MNPELIDPAATPDQVLDAKLCLELLKPDHREVMLNRFFFKKTLEVCAAPHRAWNAHRIISASLRQIRRSIDRELADNHLDPIDVYRPITFPPKPPKGQTRRSAEQELAKMVRNARKLQLDYPWFTDPHLRARTGGRYQQLNTMVGGTFVGSGVYDLTDIKFCRRVFADFSRRVREAELLNDRRLCFLPGHWTQYLHRIS